MDDRLSPSILTTEPAGRHLDLAQAIRWVRAHHGRSVAAQLRDIAVLSGTGQRLEPRNYFLYGLFRPDFDRARQRSYVSTGSGRRLNLRLSPVSEDAQHGMLFNKVLAGLVLDRAGYPTTPIRAIYTTRFALPAVRMLQDAEAVAAYLRETDAVPCFGKPVCSSMGVGALSIVETADAGETLVLGDGRAVATGLLSQEIAALYPDGYLFQPLIRQHPDVEAVNGTSVGVLRVVTLASADGPDVLYTVLKMPAPGSMTDGLSTKRPNGMAHVDWQTGRILRAQDLARMTTTALTASLVTGKPLAGVTLPFTREAAALAREVHRLFPAHGLLGYDIALTEVGPVIGEINSRPFHTLYQAATDRGFLNPDFLPRLAEAERRAAERAAAGFTFARSR